MKRENINYLVVGVFVLTMLVAFLVILYKITGRTGPTDNYYVTYSNVTGIKYGTPVLYEGFQIGQVENIVPVREPGQTRYRLALSVAKDWGIPSDSIASIVASGLLSAITIDIKEGTSQTMLVPGDMLEGREAANIFAVVNDVAGELQELSRNNLKPLITNLNYQIESLGNELRDLTTQSIRPMIDNINHKFNEQVVTDLTTLLEKLNENADRLLSLLDDKNQNNLEQFLVNMETASVALNDLLFRIEDTRAAMNEVLIDIDGLVTDNRQNFKTSINDLQKTLDTVSDNINSIVYHMEGSSRNMHELSRQLRENPGLILDSSPQPDEEGSGK
ncbi:MAG: MlaD protein [Gammaproteobacteria bacterium]|nr:MlaD protein [Gammaproteobacteria bacterium]